MVGNRSHMATIRDVAELAGVSTATVSRTLATPQQVSSEMRRKVLRAIRQSGYVPNLLARNLRRLESRTTLVLVPDIANPFFAEIIRGIEEVAHRNSYSVILGDTQRRARRERAYSEMLLSRQADGLILLTGRVPALLARKPHASPIVIACERIDGLVLPTVVIDNQRSARVATEHLIGLGHRRIGFITGPPGNVLTRDRLTGYRAALAAAAIPVDPALIIAGDFSVASGIAASRHLLGLASRPTALVASNDEMALGAVQAVKQAALRVPGDLSVVGFDDIRFAAVCDPPLTTISQPRQQIGRSAMTMLLARLGNPHADPEQIVLPTELVVRASTAPPGATVTPSRRPASVLP
jgi:LacI family repressor for deo operon, udp, cdd, tsx, nupC, and nupG